MNFFKKLVTFIRGVAEDERIPSRDKKVVLGCLALILSPVDLIPDWIPVIGVVDDFVLVAIVLDYFFNVLDDQILLSHYPWGMKSFVALKKLARLVTLLTPPAVKNRIWKFEKTPF